MTDPAQLIDAYLDGTLSGEQQQQLEDDLVNDPRYADAFAATAMIDVLLSERFERDTIAKSMRLSTGDFLGEQDVQVLQQGYNNAKDEDDGLELPPIHIDSSRPLTRKVYASALSYVVRHTFTPKRVAVLASAAVLLLGVVLGILLMGGPEPQDQIVETPELRDTDPKAVATLTAEHGAVWDRRPGQDLYAGQRFTLTAGFAEITTHRGAVATLEAPATFELIDNNNAIRLHAGKLVGVCEIDSAKGFLVRTPHVDVVDIGTRFEVVLSDDQGTRISVQEGVVSTSPANGTDQHANRLLRENQFMKISLDGRSSNAYEWVHQITDIKPISTGHDIESGERDPQWKLLDGEDERPLFVMPHNGTVWLKGDPTTSQWLSPSVGGETHPLDVFTFATTLALPEGTQPDTARVRLRYLADDALEAVWVNGKRVASDLPLPRPDLDDVDHKQYQTWSTLELTEGFRVGSNDIRFDVRNKKHTFCFRAELTGTVTAAYISIDGGRIE